MLFTDRDEPTDWLRAGQAMQRALLTATSMGVSASFLTQPLELADLAFQYDPRDSHASRLIGPSGHRLPSVHRAVDAAQRTSTSPIERRGYVRRHLLGATPWLEVPQMVIRVGYPRDGAGRHTSARHGPSRTSSTRAPIRRVAFRAPRPVRALVRAAAGPPGHARPGRMADSRHNGEVQQPEIQVRPVGDGDRPTIAWLMVELWGSELQVVHQSVFRPADLPGLIAERAGAGRAAHLPHGRWGPRGRDAQRA